MSLLIVKYARSPLVPNSNVQSAAFTNRRVFIILRWRVGGRTFSDGTKSDFDGPLVTGTVAELGPDSWMKCGLSTTAFEFPAPLNHRNYGPGPCGVGSLRTAWSPSHPWWGSWVDKFVPWRGFAREPRPPSLASDSGPDGSDATDLTVAAVAGPGPGLAPGTQAGIMLLPVEIWNNPSRRRSR